MTNLQSLALAHMQKTFRLYHLKHAKQANKLLFSLV